MAKKKAKGDADLGDDVRAGEERGDFMVGKEIAPGMRLRCICRGHTGPIGQIAWSPCGRFVASTSTDETVHIWDASDGSCVAVLNHQSAVASVAWSPDGSTLATADYKQPTVHFWDAKRLRTRGPDGPERAKKPNKSIQLFILGSKKRWDGISFPSYVSDFGMSWHPQDRSKLAAAISVDGSDRFLSFVDAKMENKQLYRLDVEPTTVAWSPNGTHLAIAGCFCIVAKIGRSKMQHPLKMKENMFGKVMVAKNDLT